MKLNDCGTPQRAFLHSAASHASLVLRGADPLDFVLVGDAAVPLDGGLEGFALGEHEDHVVVAAFEELRPELFVVGLLVDDADDVDLAVCLIGGDASFGGLEGEDGFHEFVAGELDAFDGTHLGRWKPKPPLLIQAKGGGVMMGVAPGAASAKEAADLAFSASDLAWARANS